MMKIYVIFLSIGLCTLMSGCDILEGEFTWVYEPDCKLTPQRLEVRAESGRMRLSLRNDNGSDVRSIEGDSETGNEPIVFDADGTDEPAIFSQSKFPRKMSAGEVTTVEDTSRETFTDSKVYNKVDYNNGDKQLECEVKKKK